MTPDLEEFAQFAGYLADIARQMLSAAAKANRTVEVKPDRSFVTATDKAIEQKLRQLITARYPEHGIIGEEEGRERESSRIQWVLDPIDGTAPFIAGVPVFGSLIALAIDDIPVIGVMDFPMTHERWIGLAGKPTLLNGTPCRTRDCMTLNSAIMATMNPDFFASDEKAKLEALRAATAWRIYGTSSLGYGLLASGRIDLGCDTRLAIYDFASYRPIIEGAGGKITDWSGLPITLRSGPQILATGDGARHQEALDLIKNAAEISS